MRKLKSQKGFTLMEMLACTVTLLLIGMIVSTGMNLATMSLTESTFEADSQMLESTLNTYVGDILRFATDVDTSGENITFTNDAYGIDTGHFEIKDGYLVCTSLLNGNNNATMVANKGIYLKHLYITDFSLNYNSEKNVFTGSYYIASSTTATKKFCEFSYRTIAE